MDECTVITLKDSFYWKKKHDKACIYCYILLQSFPRMNYFNTTYHSADLFLYLPS